MKLLEIFLVEQIAWQDEGIEAMQTLLGRDFDVAGGDNLHARHDNLACVGPSIRSTILPSKVERSYFASSCSRRTRSIFISSTCSATKRMPFTSMLSPTAGRTPLSARNIPATVATSGWSMSSP